jgi:hypothetical protein
LYTTDSIDGENDDDNVVVEDVGVGKWASVGKG